MRFLSYLVFSIYILFCQQAVANPSSHFVSLGRDCQTAGMLKAFGLRPSSLPLDWVISTDFKGVIKAFKDDFKYFLDPSFLTYKTNVVVNDYYGFLYGHFFPVIGSSMRNDVFVTGGKVVENYLDYLPEVEATQGRRIKRLLKFLSSGNERIVFIRSHCIPEEAAEFVSTIKAKYPNLDFLLVVVHERSDLIGDWGIENVVNFYASKRSGTGDWWDGSEWNTILNQVFQISSPQKSKKNRQR